MDKTWGELLEQVNRHIKHTRWLLLFEISFVAVYTVFVIVWSMMSEWLHVAFNLFCCCFVLYNLCKTEEFLATLYDDKAKCEFFGEMMGWDI